RQRPTKQTRNQNRKKRLKKNRVKTMDRPSPLKKPQKTVQAMKAVRMNLLKMTQKKTDKRTPVKKRRKNKTENSLKHQPTTVKTTPLLNSASCPNSQSVKISKQTISTRLTIIL